MSTQINLKNSTDTTLSITHSDGANTKVIDSTDIAVAIDTVADFPANPNNGDVVIVRGYYTSGDGGGGTFIYDSSKVADSNSGTNFSGWIRQYSGAVSIEWFGADNTGTTDSYTAFYNATLLNEPIELKDKGIYKIETKLELSNYPVRRRGFFCKGQAIITTTAITTSIIKIRYGSGDMNKACLIEGIRFERNGNIGSAIELDGVDGIRINRCYFYGFESAILFHNEHSGGFTEGNIVSESRFSNNKHAVEYKKTSGTESFHGTGIENCWIDNISTYSPIKIGSGCFIYNSVMTFNCFGSTLAPIFENNSSQLQLMHGAIKIEGACTLATSGAIFYNGIVSGISNFYHGNVFLTLSSKMGGPTVGNINRANRDKRVEAIKTSSNNQIIDIGGSDGTYTLITNYGLKCRFTAYNNYGAMPYLSIISLEQGSPPTLTHSGDTLQLVVPTAGSVVIVVCEYNVENYATSYAGKALENYREV